MISVKHMDLLNLEYFEAPEIFNEHPTDIIIMQDFWRFNQFLDNQNYFKKVYQEGTFSVYLAPAAQKFSYTYPVSAVDYTIDKFFKSKSVKYLISKGPKSFLDKSNLTILSSSIPL